MRNFADQLRNIIAPEQPAMRVATIVAIDFAKATTRIAIGSTISDIPRSIGHRVGQSVVVHGPAVVSEVPGRGRRIDI